MYRWMGLVDCVWFIDCACLQDVAMLRRYEVVGLVISVRHFCLLGVVSLLCLMRVLAVLL